VAVECSVHLKTALSQNTIVRAAEEQKRKAWKLLLKMEMVEFANR
jgi:hypothetical protein